MKNTFQQAIKGTGRATLFALAMMIICGLIFPSVVTGISTLIFPNQSKGNLIEVNGKSLGSKYVGQEFTKDYFLWSRPSANHYNTYSEENGKKSYSDGSEFGGIASGGYNQGASNPELKERIDSEINKVLESNPGLKKEDIPVDLVTASGSGLDPNISPKSADIQVERIAKASGISEEKIREIIKTNTSEKALGVFGEDKVNVLMVNIEIAKEMNLI